MGGAIFSHNIFRHGPGLASPFSPRYRSGPLPAPAAHASFREDLHDLRRSIRRDKTRKISQISFRSSKGERGHHCRECRR
ncbi:hypothetical protein BU16DRAFT_15307 [Lophium mytilinum]|uniref:Uncharacterized protein n=1 Tax=Lophium mytilinum TaxID=390894 RepID=A0A6A6RE09_9PEZI|nr:hypothetical protein BU16DRAFT_15307 [Lophium mytilinum]